MSVDDKIAVLDDFHEFRQEQGLAGAHWESAVAAYERHLQTEERADIVKSMRDLLSGDAGAGLSPSEREEQLLRLLESIA